MHGHIVILSSSVESTWYSNRANKILNSVAYHKQKHVFDPFEVENERGYKELAQPYVFLLPGTPTSS